MAQLLNQLVDLDEILYVGDGIEYYLDHVLFNTVASYQNGGRLNF
jgi:hypothetical protein